MSWGYKNIARDDEVLAHSLKLVSNSNGTKIYEGKVLLITVRLFVSKECRKALVSPVSEYGGCFNLKTTNIKDNCREILKIKKGKLCRLTKDF
jgi:hypothetical protein